MNDEQAHQKKNSEDISEKQKERLNQKKELAKKMAVKKALIKKLQQKKTAQAKSPQTNTANVIAQPNPNKKQSQQKLHPKNKNNFQSQISAKSRKKFQQSDIISKLHYRQIRKNIRKATIKQFLILLIITIGLGYAFYIYLSDQYEKRTIMQYATKGLAALESDETTIARSFFDQALSLFTQYHPDPSPNQWNADANVYSSMFKVSEGYRSLGEFNLSINTLGELAKRNIHQRERWVAENLKYYLKDVILSQRWSDEQIRHHYEYMLKIQPATWGPGAYFQAWATELAGLRIKPIEERYFEADLIVYGVPQPIIGNKFDFRVEGIRYYKVDRLPGPIELSIPAQLDPMLLDRLQWYGDSNYECLIFAENTETGYQFMGIEGIVLSDHHTVDPFNELVLEYES